MLKTRLTKVCYVRAGMAVRRYLHGGLPLRGVIQLVRPLEPADCPEWSESGWVMYRGVFRRRIEIEVEQYGDRPPFPIGKRPTLVIRPHVRDRLPIIRTGRCSKPCCSHCRRTVAPRIDYCQDHWNSVG